MEDASAIDLDWFWRGWFYSTVPVDIALSEVNSFKLDSGNPMIEKAKDKKKRDEGPRTISQIRNDKEIKQTYSEIDPTILDFYNSYDPLDATEMDKKKYEKYYASLSDNEKEFLNAGYNFYELSFTNEGWTNHACYLPISI